MRTSFTALRVARRPRRLCLTTVILVLGAVPSWSQEGTRRPTSGEIQIPSERTLEREAVTQPRNDFSTNDATATRQMDRQDRRIDSEVERGICDGC